MDLNTAITLIFIFVTIYCSVYFLLVWKLFRKRDPKPKNIPAITIVIPAYNEEKNIIHTINKCLNLSYPKDKLQIFVVNDGSTDRTKEICEEYSRKGLIKLLNKKNTGKANSLNFALKKIKTNLFCTLDADSYLDKNAFMKMIGYFDDEKVGAVISTINTKRGRGLLYYFQFLEYSLTSFFRKAFSLDDAMFITHGAGCLFRTDLVKKFGGFDEKNKTEDLEMALKLVKNGYKIKTSLYGSSATKVPTTFKGFYKQRIRWYTGFFVNVFRYRSLLLNPRFGTVGLFALPLNCLWIFAIIYLVTTISYQLIFDAYNFLLSATYVGLDFALKSSRLFLNITSTISILTVIIFLIFLPIYLISIGRRNITKNFIVYAAYLYVYNFINSILWIIALVKSLRGREGWRKKD